MADYVWPDDLVPFAMEFRLQPHTGGSESPFSRVGKFYELSAPRWIAVMSFRGGYDGTRDQAAYGPRLDAWLAKIKGRANRVAIYDFRRSKQRSQWLAGVGNDAALAGATSITITGLKPGTPIYAGDYLGGDGRPHIIVSDEGQAIAATADNSGEATVSFEPPLAADIAGDAAIFREVTGWFRLLNDDAGSNMVAVGELQQMTLEFAEDLQAAPAS